MTGKEARKQGRRKKQETLKAERERKRGVIGRPPRYVSSKALSYKIAEYMRRCDSTVIDAEKGKTEPYTLTGLQLAMGFDNKTYQRYKTGGQDERVIDNYLITEDGGLIEDINSLPTEEKRYITACDEREDLQPYMEVLYNEDLEGIKYSTVIEKARQLVAQQAELRLYIRGSVADIFTLKSKHGWQEQQTTVHRIEIATEEEAREALQELRLLDI